MTNDTNKRNSSDGSELTSGAMTQKRKKARPAPAKLPKVYRLPMTEDDIKQLQADMRAQKEQADLDREVYEVERMHLRIARKKLLDSRYGLTTDDLQEIGKRSMAIVKRKNAETRDVNAAIRNVLSMMKRLSEMEQLDADVTGGEGISIGDANEKNAMDASVVPRQVLIDALQRHFAQQSLPSSNGNGQKNGSNGRHGKAP